MCAIFAAFPLHIRHVGVNSGNANCHKSRQEKSKFLYYSSECAIYECRSNVKGFFHAPAQLYFHRFCNFHVPHPKFEQAFSLCYLFFGGRVTNRCFWYCLLYVENVKVLIHLLFYVDLPVLLKLLPIQAPPTHLQQTQFQLEVLVVRAEASSLFPILSYLRLV